MGKLPSSGTGFSCNGEIGPHTVILDRYGNEGTAFEVRLRNNETGASETPIEAGCCIFVERNEAPGAVADRLVQQLRALARRTLDEKALAEFREVAKTWLMFNFRPTLS